jgi:hypothetical protein
VSLDAEVVLLLVVVFVLVVRVVVFVCEADRDDEAAGSAGPTSGEAHLGVGMTAGERRFDLGMRRRPMVPRYLSATSHTGCGWETVKVFMRGERESLVAPPRRL